MVPACMGNFQNTRYLQIFVLVVRFLAFSLMLGAPLLYVLDYTRDDAAVAEASGPTTTDGGGPQPQSPSKGPVSLDGVDASFFVNFAGLSDLFGNAIFTYMTHHSLTGLLSPVRPETSITAVVGWSYGTCCILYIALCTSAMFAFWNGDDKTQDCRLGGTAACSIQDMYSTNFETYHVKWVGRFVDTYPVMMVALYPLVCITFRNNVRKLCQVLSAGAGSGRDDGASPSQMAGASGRGGRAENKDVEANVLVGMPAGAGLHRWASVVEARAEAVGTEAAATEAAASAAPVDELPCGARLLWTAPCALAPLAVAALVRYLNKSVQVVTTYTGSYAGLVVMLVIPSLLVVEARRVLKERGIDVAKRMHASPFSKDWHPKGVIAISIVFFIYTTIRVFF
jgi:hypothetical protein